MPPPIGCCHRKPVRLVHVPLERARTTEAGYGRYFTVAFADGYPLLLIGQASLDDISHKVAKFPVFA